VLELEKQLEALECDDFDEPDVEDVVRGGAVVKIQEHDESKFLGPSSGIAITRLVMQLAKRFTQSGSITDIVDENKAAEIKNTFAQEEDKPDSKIYPHISDIPAIHLPERQVTDTLVDFFNLRVMTMYPFLHEQTLWQDVTDVFNGSQDPFQNFEVRMVIANALQRARPEWAGLADSFYLAALNYFEAAVRPMNVRTVQCFLLIGAYSLLTPTRTAVYYVVGLATRLVQALGLSEEKTIGQGANGQPANPLEIDMRRRLFWSVLSMEYGLAHSMGRASCFATQIEHFDVGWFEIKDDRYITNDGIDPHAPRSLKKWIVVHFFKMRLLQLEIRRKLYQRKRPEPKDENDPWFIDMERRLMEWRDVTPDTEAGKGLDKAWCVASGSWSALTSQVRRALPHHGGDALPAIAAVPEAVARGGAALLGRVPRQHLHAREADAGRQRRHYLDLHAGHVHERQHDPVGALVRACAARVPAPRGRARPDRRAREHQDGELPVARRRERARAVPHPDPRVHAHLRPEGRCRCVGRVTGRHDDGVRLGAVRHGEPRRPERDARRRAVSAPAACC
jgi:Fungal specific transcription factor domain